MREENQTLATITLQNYFRLYEKLSGMTGTAMTEDAEFREIYKLPVQSPSRRTARSSAMDDDDLVYRTCRRQVRRRRRQTWHGAPCRRGSRCSVGTVAIESSEQLSRLLDAPRRASHEALERQAPRARGGTSSRRPAAWAP